MATRTKEYTLMPWQGGVVTSIDEALLGQGQLTIGDNLLFGVQGSKQKREGANKDYDSYLWTNATRASSGTTRTITGRCVGLALAVGNTVNVTGSATATYNGTALVSTVISNLTVTETSVAGLVTEGTDTINSVAHGFIDARAVYYSTTGTVIAPLVSGTFYYVRDAAANSFKLAATSGGSAINLTDDGVGSQVFHSCRISYTAAASLSESQTTDSAAVLNADVDVIGAHDFWYGTTDRTQKLMTCLANYKVVAHTAGTRTVLTEGGTAWTGTITRASLITFNNKLFVAVDGTGNLMKSWTGTPADSLINAAGTPPVASILQTHIGRIWCDDKTNKDRLHFCETEDHTLWNGNGDSGALDIGLGDGDLGGIVAIFPSFKGNLFVAKRTRLYRISGYTPETFVVELVSSGIGCVSHRAVAAVDQDDIYFVSNKGVHSLAATDQYGSFSSTYASADIQKTINEDWTRSRFPYIKAAYVAEINSVAFAVSDESETENNFIWFYNIPLKAWYRWTDLSCQTMITATDVDKSRLYLGTNEGRLIQTFAGTVYDTNKIGTSEAIHLEVATGLIFPDGQVTQVKGFKKFGLIYKPVGPHSVTASLKIDNFATQSRSFAQTTDGDLLGVDFVLGTSVLGYEVTLSPYTQSIDGYGRGIKVNLTQSGINEQVDLQGFSIEYESAMDQQETRAGDTS